MNDPKSDQRVVADGHQTVTGHSDVTAPTRVPTGSDAQALGPVLESRADAHRAAADIWELADTCDSRTALTEANHAKLLDACHAAGVYLGAYDHRILRWLSQWEPELVQVVVGLIYRANPREP